MKQLKIYSQTPYARLDDFNKVILELIRNSEEYNYNGILVVYSGQGYDPWIVAMNVFENSQKIVPLIAVQTDELTPDILATRVESIASIYNRAFDINMITGNAVRQQQSIEVAKSPNRYDWLADFIGETKKKINTDLYSANGEISKFYLSGSSNAGFKAALSSADGFLTVPSPFDDFSKLNLERDNDNLDLGICFGIIARATSSEAWETSRAMFPSTREDFIKTAMKRNSKLNSISYLAQLLKANEVYDKVYWLGVFRSGVNGYPYLIGSYDEVAEYLYKYILLGINTLILNGPFSKEEFFHREQVFKRLRDREIQCGNSI